MPRLTPLRRAIGFSSLGAGVSYANLAIALPLVALADGGTALLAGTLLALHTIAISAGALCALVLRRPETGVAAGLLLVAAGAVVLVLPPSVPSLALGALVHGTGHGLFWVGIQGGLGRRSGAPGSERAFVLQYSMYVAGTVVGGAATGIGVAAARAVGVDKTTSIALTFLIGAAGALLALPPVVVWLRGVTTTVVARPRVTFVQGLGLQVPDLLLVGAMGLLVSLAPVVLTEVFELRPLAVGLTGALYAVAKIAGSLAAGRLARRVGTRLTVGTMLGVSAAGSAALIAVDTPLPFVAVSAAAVLFGIGAWPIMVDGALARIRPEERARVTIAWNAREYAAIALTTVVGGYLLDLAASPAAPLAIAAALLAGAALSALVVLRAPAHPPGRAPEPRRATGEPA